MNSPKEIDAFRSAPGDWQFEIDVEVGLIIIFADSQSARKTKVRDFHFVFGENQHVSEIDEKKDDF